MLDLYRSHVSANGSMVFQYKRANGDILSFSVAPYYINTDIQLNIEMQMFDINHKKYGIEEYVCLTDIPDLINKFEIGDCNEHKRIL